MKAVIKIKAEVNEIENKNHNRYKLKVVSERIIKTDKALIKVTERRYKLAIAAVKIRDISANPTHVH